MMETSARQSLPRAAHSLLCKDSCSEGLACPLVTPNTFHSWCVQPSYPALSQLLPISGPVQAWPSLVLSPHPLQREGTQQDMLPLPPVSTSCSSRARSPLVPLSSFTLGLKNHLSGLWWPRPSLSFHLHTPQMQSLSLDSSSAVLWDFFLASVRSCSSIDLSPRDRGCGQAGARLTQDGLEEH